MGLSREYGHTVWITLMYMQPMWYNYSHMYSQKYLLQWGECTATSSHLHSCRGSKYIPLWLQPSRCTDVIAVQSEADIREMQAVQTKVLTGHRERQSIKSGAATLVNWHDNNFTLHQDVGRMISFSMLMCTPVHKGCEPNAKASTDFKCCWHLHVCIPSRFMIPCHLQSYLIIRIHYYFLS